MSWPRTAISPLMAVEAGGGGVRRAPRASPTLSRRWKADTVLREDLLGEGGGSVPDGAHGPRRHANHIFTWEAGDRESRRRQVLAEADVVAEEMVYYHRTHPCPLETCGCGRRSMDKVTGKLTLYGTFQAPHAIRTVVSLISGIEEHNIRVMSARYRRRVRQQGRRLCGLCLLCRRLHRHRASSGEMGRGPDGEPDVHRVRARLLDAGQDRRHKGGQDHWAVVPHHRRSRRV